MKLIPLKLEFPNPFYIGILETATAKKYLSPLLGVYISDGIVAVYLCRREFVVWEGKP